MPDQPLKTTILNQAHRALKARMVAFGGYDMPVQYEMGVLKEHLWTREHAGVFDVSHMGPCFLDLAISGGDPEERRQAVASLIEPLVSGDIAGLKPGQLRYTLLLNEEGGILDDLMIGRPSDPNFQGRLYIVVNAGTKEADLELIAEAAGRAARLSRADDGGLIAVQGPDAAGVVGELFPQSRSLSFMTFERMPLERRTVRVSRSGYTGEDGFELLAADDRRRRPVAAAAAGRAGAADRPRCPRFAATGGGSAALRPRPGSDRLTRGGRARLRRVKEASEGRRPARSGTHPR